LSVLALIWGILSILGLMVAFIPCLGSLNWLNIPFSGIGLIISILAASKEPPGKKGMANVGIVLCAIAVSLGIVRLMMGGGIL
jgi:hypothetical protein